MANWDFILLIFQLIIIEVVLIDKKCHGIINITFPENSTFMVKRQLELSLFERHSCFF